MSVGPLERRKPAPRWSVARPAGFAPVSLAALPEPRACVGVKPPLLVSGPRFRAARYGRLLPLWGDSTPGPGSSPMALKLAVTVPLPPLVRSSLAVPATADVLPERMVLSSVTAPPARSLERPPPAPLPAAVVVATLPVMVLF